MTDQERNQVLKMIEQAKITPEEGLQLMQALEQSPAEDPAPVVAEEPPGTPQPEKSAPPLDPRLEQLKSTARRLWQIPLWIGVVITILSAWGMAALLRGAGMNFWFFFLLLPLFLGVAVIALAVGSRRARWIFVDVQQHPGGYPQRIFLGFPLPLKFAAWFLRSFGRVIPDLQGSNVDEIVQFLENGFIGSEPLIVNVDEGAGRERVRVYIG
jgi:hypothetical protein